MTNLDHLAEEIRAIIVEHEFQAHEIVLEGWHQVGTLLIQVNANTEILQRIAATIGRSERMLRYAKKFATSYKRVGEVPLGKNMTWSKVIKLLTTSENKEHTHHFIEICASCRERKPTATSYS